MVFIFANIFTIKHVIASPGDMMVYSPTMQTGNAVVSGTYKNPQQGCPTTEQLRAKYEAGCWSCLVMEKLTSAFLYAADKGLGITKKAGIVVLLVGSGIWILFWGLKNVSSFTQLQLGNIINELFKFLFKVMFAYWFIIYSNTAISKYFVSPMMGIGASISEGFWHGDIKNFTQNYIWDDEDISDEDQKNIDAALDAGNQNEQTNNSSASDSADTLPEPVENDSYEDTVQQFQKSFVAILQRYLQEIQNSCVDSPYVSENSPKCRQTDAEGKSCRDYANCDDRGHRNYIRGLYQKAGSQGEGGYSTVAITAALEELNKEIGGDIANFQTGKVDSADGLKVGSQYENAAIVGENGGDVDLSSAIKYANVGDIVYIKVNGALANTNNQASGYHTTVYAGGGKLIGFNIDNLYQNIDELGNDVSGKIIRFSEIIRQRLKANPDAAINRTALSSKAKESGISGRLNNYQGGTYSSFYPGKDSLTPSVPDNITYTGPESIVPKSVMNSMLGAIRAITYKLSDIKVLGNSIMCYAGLENGGAINVKVLKGVTLISVPNGFIWISGAIIWCLGFLLVVAVSYYFLDISFKIGFAVLAFPIVMGLWPFNMTQGRLFIIISIIAKSAAFYAFLALVTSFGLSLFGESATLGGLDVLFDKMDQLASGSATEEMEEELNNEINNSVYLFSPIFVMMIFALIYFYKLVQQTSSDLVNKFFPDNAFGDSSPMHSTATMMTDYTRKMATSITGANLAKDIVANQAGIGVKKLMQGTGRAIAHPVQTARNIGSKFRGKKSSGEK